MPTSKKPCGPRSPRVIQTIAKRGDRLIAPVAQIDSTQNTGPLQDRRKYGPSPVRTKAQLLRLALAGATLLVALLGISKIGRVRNWPNAGTNPQIHSLAVLPLRNLSSDPSQEYFSDGLTDALITDLAQLGSLKVISHTSTIQYKDAKKTLPQIARELNVDGIIEGTVQRSGDRVRITAQLIHGPSDKHIWANSYERDMHDVFALERDVTEDIVHQIQARLIAPVRRLGNL